MGLTSQGFTPKTLQEIRDDISSNLKIELGNDIDTTASSRIGQFIDIVSNEIYSAWLGLQDTYNAFYPDTSSGTSLDNVVAITNTVRKAATSSSASVYFAGVSSTLIPTGSLVQKTGTDERLATTADITISDTSNLIISNNVSDAGTITLSWDSEAIAAINYNDTTATIKSKIEAHSKISDVVVIGQLNTVGGFHILFNTDTLISREVTIDANSLERDSELLTTNGYFSVDEPPSVLAVNTGEIALPSLSVRTITTPILGLSEVVNFDVGITGTERETDAELRARREDDLQKSGTTTLGGMRKAVESVTNVVNVTIVENDTSVTDPDGRPHHSVEVFVTAVNDQETRDNIAQAIYDTKPIGIGVVTTVSAPDQRVGDIVDVNEIETTLTYSSPDSIGINLEVTLTLSSASEGTTYPDNGDQQVKDALVLYFATLELGNDVKNHSLYSPVNTVPGIETIVILQSLKPVVPVASTNIPIAITEVAVIENSATDIVVIT